MIEVFESQRPKLGVVEYWRLHHASFDRTSRPKLKRWPPGGLVGEPFKVIFNHLQSKKEMRLISRKNRSRSYSTLLLLLPLAIIVASCGSSQASLPPPIATTTASTIEITSPSQTSETVAASQKVTAKWVINSNVLKVLSKYQKIFSYITTQGVIEVTPIGSTPLVGEGIIPAVKFASSKRLVQAISSGLIPTWAKAVVYDPEAWSLTPLPEQENPVTASDAASVAVRGAGLIYVVTPALDLTKVLAPGTPFDGQSLVALNLYGNLAKSADVMVVQSQSLEGDPTKFKALLSQSSKQANTTNSNIDLLGGLSTNLHGTTATISELTSSFSSGTGYVNGFWFNVPGYSVECPTCTQPNFPLAESFYDSVLS